MNEVRIIGGDWRSRRLRFPDAESLRPTPDRVRETVFNWLQFDIRGKRCLDAFAGSGVLGFEALSRGAESVLFMEQNRAVMRQLQANAELLKATNAEFLQNDTMHALDKLTPPHKFDLVFLDPPFASDVISTCLTVLATRQWLADDATIYIESPRDLASLELPAGWSWIRQQHAGQVYFGLVRCLNSL
jgi:16S rRNA (guanine966-N2)-methyltransferase